MPPVLTYRGDIALASRPCVAMVGARNASAAAVKLARDFAMTLAEEGLLIAEQPPPGTEPRGSHFPSRNRIIAGLAAGTVVV